MKQDSLLLTAALGIGFCAGMACHAAISRLGSKQEKAKGDGEELLIGIDIGGTGAKVGVVRADGKICASASRVLQDKTFQGVCTTVYDLVQEMLEQQNLTIQEIFGVGICIPGSVDSLNGVVCFAANFPEWPANAPLASRIKELLGIAFTPKLENDGNVALLGEIWAGAAQKSANAAMLTLGTGVGSAFIIDGRVIHGSNNFAAEMGHMIIERNGRYSANTDVHGNLEEYVSARAIGIIAQEAVEEASAKGSSSLLCGITPRDSITSKHVFDLAKQGDELAIQLAEDAFDILGVACINIVRMLDVDTILLGGGLVGAGNILLDGVVKHFKKHYWKLDEPSCEIKIAHLGPEAGIVGAAYLGHPCRR